MTSDANKDIAKIIYNHLNLPVEINFVGGNKIQYLYNAVGQKVRKQVCYSVECMTTDYLDGFQYTNQILNFFPHAEGYVNANGNNTNGYKFFYVYNFTDHLGNIRVSYGKDPDTSTLKILEENHYYPFGLKHSNYNSGKKKFDLKDLAAQQQQNQQQALEYRIKQLVAGEYVPYNYKYNGKELQDELGLNFYDYGARNYDPAIGRWMNIDPLAEQGRRWSLYNYALDNPVYFVDPDGMLSQSFISKILSSENGTTWTNNGQDEFTNNMNDEKITKDEENDCCGGILKAIGNSIIDGIVLAAPTLQVIDKIIPRFDVNDEEQTSYIATLVIIAVIDPSPIVETRLIKHGIGNLDDLLKVAGKFSKGKTKIAEKTIKGNIDEVFEKITKGGELTPGGAYKMPDGRIISKHTSTTSQLPTISVNEAGKRMQKIRFEK